MKFCVLTLGCKANQAESSYIESLFLKNSHVKVPLNEEPDICIINTCSVTSKSDYQSRQLIRRALNAGSRVFATGCYSELNSEEIRSISPSVEIIKNSQKKLYFLNRLAKQKGLIHVEALIETLVVTNGGDYGDAYRGAPEILIPDRSRAFIKIQDGCNSRCSYCIIPEARGGTRSTSMDDVVREAMALEDNGFKEIVLTGIHIGYYGYQGASGQSPECSLALLIETILKNTSKVRIRLTSLEVTEITDEIIYLFSNERVCGHIHVPLQSGNDTILKAMNRPYDTSVYREVVERLHSKVENISIGSDVIVGFPGETEDLFLSTVKFLAELPLTYLHVFPFSRRPHTKAYYMDGQIEQSVKKQRAQILRELSSEMKHKYMENQLGRILEAVIEQINGSHYAGTTGNYLKVVIDSGSASSSASPKDAITRKSLIKLVVTGNTESYLLGKPISGT